MYSNIGGKIKGLAVFVCIAGMVASIFGGWYFASTIGRSMAYAYGYGYYGGGDITGTQVVLFILFAGLGSLFSWMGSLSLYGFGQLVEDTDQIRSDMKDLKADVKALSVQKPAAPAESGAGTVPSGFTGVPVKDPDPTIMAGEGTVPESGNASSSGAPVAPLMTDSPHIIQCPECGMKQIAGRSKCARCGTAFLPEAARDTRMPEIMNRKPEENICPQCGTKNEDDSLFCYKCGTRLKP